MCTLEVTQKSMRTSMEVMDMEFDTGKGKETWVLYSYEHDSRKYILQKEGNSPSHL